MALSALQDPYGIDEEDDDQASTPVGVFGKKRRPLDPVGMLQQDEAARDEETNPREPEGDDDTDDSGDGESENDRADTETVPDSGDPGDEDAPTETAPSNAPPDSQTSQFEHEGTGTLADRQGTTGPSPTTPGTHYPRPALDAYRKNVASMPTMPDPKKASLWRKIANTAYRGGAGWVNAAGRTHVDPRAADGLLYPGYGSAMSRWQTENNKLHQLADLEEHQSRTDLQMGTQEARQKAYEAMQARAMRPPGQGTPPKLDVSDPVNVQKRMDLAKTNGWNADDPQIRGWILTGKQGTAPKTAAPPRPSTSPLLLENDPNVPPEVRARAKAINDAKLAESKARISHLNRMGGDGSPVERPMTAGQRHQAVYRASLDTQKAYSQAEKEFSATHQQIMQTYGATEAKAIRTHDQGLLQMAQQQRDQALADLNGKHNTRKQAIEDGYKQNIESVVGTPQPRAQFGGQSIPVNHPAVGAPQGGAAPPQGPPPQGHAPIPQGPPPHAPAPAPPPQAPGKFLKTATNPRTGEKIGWNGQAWVPIGRP